MNYFKELDSSICCKETDINDLSIFLGNILNYYNFEPSIGGISFLKGDDGFGMNIKYSGGFYSINIHEKYFRFIYDFLYIILSDNSLFPNVGSSSKIVKLDSLNYNFPKTHFDLICDLEESGKPKFNIERRNLHNFFYKLIMRFLLMHEFHHITSGHNDFLSSLGVKNSKDAVEKNILTNLDIQTLEMDADVISIQDLLKLLLDSSDIPKQFNSEEGIIESLLFISFFVFHILPKRKIKSLEQVLNSTHPSSGIRYWFILSSLAESYKLKNAELSDFIIHKSCEIIEKLKITVKNISNENLDIQELIDVIDPAGEGMQYSGEVVQNWNKLRPVLEIFASKKLVRYTPEFINSFDMSFDELLGKINYTKFCYLSMLFQLQNLSFQLDNFEMFSGQKFELSVNGGHEGYREIKFKSIIDFINSLTQDNNIHYHDLTSNFIILNAHSLRTKAIIDLYIILNGYSGISLRLINFNWFKILYLLYQSIIQTSKTIIFPLDWKYLLSVEWNGIRVVDGQLIFLIKYNDSQIIDLFDCVINFLQKNKNDFIFS
ncbi:hypothetical protein HNP24_001553 [Chryseobacterium sediminis]|uniref:Uncharacterized protein n=1 Tax=Chryseobacterium sediminis TaxID=1679494 RepID=A0ABR6Q0G6_9FLAO|nr:hypothetical protein [Chryseobacterium sediminis]MBB6330603.1 hypothetical protein [Chryseobacterium sediminis]